MMTQTIPLLDLDGCLYRFHPETNEACSEAAAHALIAHGGEIEFEEAFAHFMSVRNPAILPAQLDASRIDTVAFHHAYHNTVSMGRIVEPVDGLAAVFTETSAPLLMLTHGSRRWAMQVLEYLGVREFFEERHIFALEDVHFQQKDKSSAPFLYVAEQTGFRVQSLAMIEDSARNLAIPHALGMPTRLIHHGNALAHLPEHVHSQHSLMRDVFDSLSLLPAAKQVAMPRCVKGGLLPK